MIVTTDLSTIDETLDGQTINAVRGTLDTVYQVKKGTGRNNRPYHLQGAKLVDGHGNSLKITFDDHPDMSHYKGREVYIVAGEGEGRSGSLYVKHDDKYGTSLMIGKNATVTENPDFGTGASPTGDKKEYWVCLPDGEPYAASANEIQALVDKGTDFDCCKYGASEWSQPGQLGFVKSAPKPPPASQPAPPPQKAAPPQHTAQPQEQPAPSGGPKLPEGVFLKELSYNETRQIQQFEPVKIELSATIQTVDQIRPTFEYLKAAVRHMLKESS